MPNFSLRKVDVLIAGVEKAGTTSLLRYLSSHGDVLGHDSMEMPYFVNDKIYNKGWAWSLNRYYGTRKIEKKILLAKSVGCIYWPSVPERLYNHNQNMKIIVVLRNPIERAYSSYRYAIQMGREYIREFSEAIQQEEVRLKRGCVFHERYNAYLRRGLYGQQVRRMLSFFPKEQIKIVLYEKFKDSPVEVLRELFKFMEIEFVDVDTSVKHNETEEVNGLGLAFLHNCLRHAKVDGLKCLLRNAKNNNAGCFPLGIRPVKNKIDEVTKQKMVKYYQGDLAELEKIINVDLKHWLV